MQGITILVKLEPRLRRMFHGKIQSIYKGAIVSAHSQHTMLSHSLRAFCEQVLGYS